MDIIYFRSKNFLLSFKVTSTLQSPWNKEISRLTNCTDLIPFVILPFLISQENKVAMKIGDG